LNLLPKSQLLNNTTFINAKTSSFLTFQAFQPFQAKKESKQKQFTNASTDISADAFPSAA
jgi:hypothetical protein